MAHHLEAVFVAHQIHYVRGAVNENRQRPDFLFPNLEAYEAAPIDGAPHLFMLGPKFTYKDRWRQVLVEASEFRTSTS